MYGIIQIRKKMPIYVMSFSLTLEQLDSVEDEVVVFVRLLRPPPEDVDQGAGPALLKDDGLGRLVLESEKTHAVDGDRLELPGLGLAAVILEDLGHEDLDAVVGADVTLRTESKIYIQQPHNTYLNQWGLSLGFVDFDN